MEAEKKVTFKLNDDVFKILMGESTLSKDEKKKVLEKMFLEAAEPLMKAISDKKAQNLEKSDS